MNRNQGSKSTVLELDAELQICINNLAKVRGVSAGEIVRAAIEKYTRPVPRQGSWLDRAESFGLIGCSSSR